MPHTATCTDIHNERALNDVSQICLDNTHVNCVVQADALLLITDNLDL